LQKLLAAMENLSIPRYTAPQKKALVLNRLTRKLAKIYTEATGRRATVSGFSGRKGGRFPQFVGAALNCLPDKWRPHKSRISGMGSRIARMNKEDAGKTISLKWIGLPYPALARSNWKNDFFRKRSGKRP
jgi:hypothetical protein